MTERDKHIAFLFTAELQFRLASAVEIATIMGKQPIDIPQEWSHGKHVISYTEVALRKDQAKFAAFFIHRSATFLMAVAMKDAIKATVPDPKNAADTNIQSAYQISRMIRNAFTHRPFHPIWSIDEDCRNRKFEVSNIISFDTKGLNGKPFDWRHYGGSLALLLLCRYVRFEILKDKRRKREIIPKPKDIYYQQGNLILRKIKKLKKKGTNHCS